MRPRCDCDAWGYMCDQGRRCPRRAQPEQPDCHGPCQRGQCPTPDACERPDAPGRSDALMIAGTAILAFAAVACAYLLAMVAANLWRS